MSGPPVVIRPAASAADYGAFADLCREYLAWSRARYGDLEWFVTEVFGHQSLDAELEKLPEKYGPPNGLTLVAERDGAIVGAGAWHRLADGVAEIKRLYVSDRGRGAGLGRKLTEALLHSAKGADFTTMRLDTGDRLAEAMALYESLGFRRAAPYLDYPARLRPHIVFFERAL